MNVPKRIDLKPEDMDAFLQRVSNRSLEEADYEIIQGMGETIKFLSHAVEEKRYSIRRLLRIIFGAKTESSKKALESDSKDKDEASGNDLAEKGATPMGGGIKDNRDKQDESKRKGHGRNGASQYTGAAKISVSNPSLRPGDPCLECLKGKVYEMKHPGVVVRVTGSPPVQATVYEQQRLRCNLCGKVYTADLPDDAGREKYDQSAGAMIALLKYGSGLPFNRLEGLQESLGVPLPASS